VTAGGRGGEGQAAVELALALPLVLVLVLAVVQVGLVVRDQVLVVHAAREAARRAAVDPAAEAPVEAARAPSGLDPDRLTVEASGRGAAGSVVTVRVRYRAPTDVPLAGALLGDVDLEARASMRVER
jgi:hypothetical protein